MSARVGGIAALALGIGYVLIIPIFLPLGAPPTGGGDAWLKYLSDKTTQWGIILGLSVATDLLYVPVALGLYTALRSVNQSAMLIAVSLFALFVVLDLAVTWTNYGALLKLSGQYMTNADGTQRAALAAAGYPAAIVGSRLLALYAIVVPGVGIGIIGVVMLRGIFNRLTAYVAIATAVLAAASLLIGPAAVFASVLTTIWMLLVGYRMLRLA